LAVALLNDPDILIMDEPTVGLDPVHRAKLWEGFRALADRGACILITTHAMDEAAHCDRVALMHDGDLIRFDAPQTIIDTTACSTLEEAFITLVSGERKGADHA
ncbi:MAG: ABC transporter ATP-binding protein, partial [Raoultibacter sp.]